MEREARQDEVERIRLKGEPERVGNLEARVRKAGFARDRDRFSIIAGVRSTPTNSRTCGAKAFARSPGPAGHIKRALVAARATAARKRRTGSGSFTWGDVTKRSTCAVNCVTVSRAGHAARYTLRYQGFTMLSTAISSRR